VIAMFDPQYSLEPGVAEQRVEAVLRPPVEHLRRNRPAATLRVASYTRRHPGKAHSRKASRSQVKRKLT